MWKLASRVEEAGVTITALTFNRLLSSHLVEGRADEAEALQPNPTLTPTLTPNPKLTSSPNPKPNSIPHQAEALQRLMADRGVEPDSMVKVAPWLCPSSAPVPPRNAPGGSGQLGTPRKCPAHWAPSHGLGCSS